MMSVNTRFSGTSLINSGLIKEKMGLTTLPKSLSQLPGESSWSSTTGVHYDTGMTVKHGEGPVLNEDDKRIRDAAFKWADQYYGGDIRKVLYQTPVSLTSNDVEMVHAGLMAKHGWTA